MMGGKLIVQLLPRCEWYSFAAEHIFQKWAYIFLPFLPSCLSWQCKGDIGVPACTCSQLWTFKKIPCCFLLIRLCYVPSYCTHREMWYSEKCGIQAQIWIWLGTHLTRFGHEATVSIASGFGPPHHRQGCISSGWSSINGLWIQRWADQEETRDVQKWVPLPASV